MAIRIVDEPIKDTYKEQLTVPANNATRNVFPVRFGWGEILIEPAAAMVLGLAPRIQALWFYDASATPKWVNLLDGDMAIINRHVGGDTGTNLDAMQTADYIYVGLLETCLGLYVDMDAGTVNANAATIAGGYSKNNNTFAALSISSDGTASGGATLAADGLIVWTVPTDWGKFSLADVLADAGAPSAVLRWVRLSVSAALSADVEIEQMAALHTPAVVGDVTTAPGMFNKANQEYTIDLSDEVGALEVIAQAAAGTTVKVSWIKR